MIPFKRKHFNLFYNAILTYSSERPQQDHIAYEGIISSLQYKLATLYKTAAVGQRIHRR